MVLVSLNPNIHKQKVYLKCWWGGVVKNYLIRSWCYIPSTRIHETGLRSDCIRVKGFFSLWLRVGYDFNMTWDPAATELTKIYSQVSEDINWTCNQVNHKTCARLTTDTHQGSAELMTKLRESTCMQVPAKQPWWSLLGCLLFIPRAPVIQHILLSFEEICHHHQHSPLLLSLNIVHYSAITYSNKKSNGIAFGKKYTCFSPHLVQGKSLKHPQGHFIFNHTMHSSHRNLKQDIQTSDFKIKLIPSLILNPSTSKATLNSFLKPSPAQWLMRYKGDQTIWVYVNEYWKSDEERGEDTKDTG